MSRAISQVYGTTLREAGRRLARALDETEHLETTLGAPSDPRRDDASEDEIAVTLAFQDVTSNLKEIFSDLTVLLRLVSTTTASSPVARTVAEALQNVTTATVTDLHDRRCAIEDVFGKKKSS